MATIWKHAPGDWCHICGSRHSATVDIQYPDNAEHETINRKYVRICGGCAEAILFVIKTSAEIDTKNRINPSGP
jgi:hypothetical protein